MTGKATQTDRHPWTYHLKRLHDQKLYRQEYGPGPWPCGSGAECVMQGWHDRITGLPEGPLDGGMVVPGDVSAIVHLGQMWHAECVVRWAMSFAEVCPNCDAVTTRGGPAVAHRKACS